MNYQEAKKIREKSYISYLTEKLSKGQGVGSAIKATLSDKSKAKSKGFSEKFDPLNIAKFMTGGSKFAPALLGSMLGRTQQDIQYFAGTKKAKEVGATATKIGTLDSDNNVMDILSKIYTLLKTTNDNDTQRREKESNFKEEQELERERRHKALIEAITGKKQTSAPTAIAVKQDDSGGLISFILGIVTGMISTAIKGVMSIIEGITDFISLFKTAFGGGIASIAKNILGLGRFLLFNPVGLAIVAGAGIAYAIWKIIKSEPSEEAKAEAAGIAQAEKVGGLPGVKNEMDRQKKLPEYDRTMAEIKDYQFNYNESEPLNNVQLKGFAVRGPGALEAVEDYKLERDRVKKEILTLNQTATPADTTPQASQAVTPTETPAPSEQMSNPKTTSKLSAITSENLELNLPSTPESVTTAQITNNTNISSTKSQKPKGPIPSVRNTEDSFQRMLFNSLRVV
jgi:hypothetical protein